MRKLLFIFLSWIAVSCAKQDMKDTVQSKNMVDVSFDVQFVDDAYSTKTYYDIPERRAVWKATDLAGVVASYDDGDGTVCTDSYLQHFSIKNISNSGEYIESASFSGKLTDMGARTYTYYALYPYASFCSTSNLNAVSAILSSVQFPERRSWDGSCDFLVSKPLTATSSSVAVSGYRLCFSRLFGILRIKFADSMLDLYGSEEVESISISSLDGKTIAGHFCVDMTSTVPPSPVFSSNSDSSDKISLNYQGRGICLNDLDAYFIMNPGEYENLSIVITTVKHTITCHRSGIDVIRGAVVSAKLNLKSEDEVADNCPILPRNPSALKILCFGHSYAQDCMSFLPSMFNAAGINNVTVAYVASANMSIQNYWTRIQNDETVGYTKSVNGKSYSGGAHTVEYALQDEDWDIIVLQTATELLGFYDSFNPELGYLKEYIKSKCTSKEPVFAWNMFWPFSSKYRRADRYERYSYDTQINYTAHINSCKELLRNKEIDIVIPSGTTIQNMRNTSLVNYNEFTRDYYHMDYCGGRYAAACTWFEALMKPCFGITILGNSFIPPIPTDDTYPYVEVTSDNIHIFQRAAVAAVSNMFEVTRGLETEKEADPGPDIIEDTGAEGMLGSYADSGIGEW